MNENDSAKNDSAKIKFVDLYNDAVLRIFPTETMIAIFGMFDEHNRTITDTEDNNKMILPTGITKIQEKIEKKEVFLKFMQTNFSDICGTTPSDVAKLQDVEKNVKKFIERMEVKVNTIIQSFIEIVVTLHDIIDNLTSTDFSSVHCLSEKVFMAILLAIQMLHYPTPINDYKLKFQFAKSYIGKSGLQKSSVICSRSTSISSLNDPVAANIFGLKINALSQKVPPPEITDDVSYQGGGSKSRRKPARKTLRRRTRKSKSKSKPKTHRRRRHSRVRKNKKYTSRK